VGEPAEDESTLSAPERAIAKEQPLHVIVCGGRDFVPRPDDGTRLCAWLFRVAPVVLHHGDASGADRWAAGLAARLDGVTVVAHPADWDTHGRAAGPRRNAEMLRDAFESGGRERPIVVAFSGGRGTADMAKKATAARCRVIKPHEERRR